LGRAIDGFRGKTRRPLSEGSDSLIRSHCVSTNAKLCGLLLAVFLPALTAQTPDVSGTWRSDSNASLQWILNQKSGNIHVRELSGNKVEADFTCSLNGTECNVKENGHSEKLIMYFNGAKLVEIRERGASAFEQRLTISADGKTLTVETVPLVPYQKPETLLFRRQTT
jgi:hypothetical protein